MIAYGDLITKITALCMAPDSHAVRELLGDVSRAENKAGRGMLSVVVVHKDGPNRGRPGNGFFTLAQELGRDTRDREKIWIGEFEGAQILKRRGRQLRRPLLRSEAARNGELRT
jgi:hypothetical protein